MSDKISRNAPSGEVVGHGWDGARTAVIERLAEVISVLDAFGYVPEVGAYGIQTAVAPPAIYREWAERLVVELGLVAVDPALVEAVRAADTKHALFSMRAIARGETYTDWDDGECGTDRTRLALAEAILAQLAPAKSAKP
jgi:hypothetical protein